MRIAVVGTGVSGLVAAWILSRRHEVTVYEADDRLGGHVNTIPVEDEGRSVPVDTGFIVFNDRTYPGFWRMLEILGVGRRPSDMSFGVRDEASGLEWCGSRRVGTLFAQKRNLFRPRFWRMLREIARFNREAARLLEEGDDAIPLGAWLEQGGYAEEFVRHYALPMGAALWSAPLGRMREFPARYFVEFFHNHGLLALRDRPAWFVVEGGSRAYVDALRPHLGDRVRLSSPVRRIRRAGEAVHLVAGDGPSETYDGVVVATHSDQALRLLEDPTPAEREVLGAIPYQPNVAVLHTDASVMPRARRAWASWNYRVPRAGGDVGRAAVTYHMNRLQGLDTRTQYFVTLNATDAIDPAKTIRSIPYDHPVYTPAGRAAQKRRAEVSGRRRTWYCGAYWGFGFHEDGVQSALDVAKDFGLGLDDVEGARA